MLKDCHAESGDHGEAGVAAAEAEDLPDLAVCFNRTTRERRWS
jgi:hypothetical protein